jgi:diguanylate cyclase (GGDEF)-like protein/PAS domain S-box-containing protein
LPIGAYRSGVDGRQLRANAALVRLNGYASEAEMLLAVNDIGVEWYVDPDQRRKFRERIERDGQVVSFRSEIYRHKTRERIWIVENAHLVRDPGGTTLYYEGTVEDVTETLRAETALAASERRFRALTEKAQVLTVVCGAQGDVLYASPAARTMLGRSPEDLHGDNIFDWIHPDEVQHAREEQLQVLAFGNQGLESIYRYRHTDGTWRYLASLASNCLADPAVLGIVLNFRDATERKRAEEAELALRESEERWKLALESAGDGVWDWNVSTGVEIYSKRFKEMYGFAEHALSELSAQFDERTHPEDRAGRDRARQAHLDGQTPTYVNEHRVRCQDGSWKWILSRGMVIRRDADGKPLRMIGTHTDISERKISEALIWQQANFDALTGLPNRRMLRERLEREIRKSDRDGSQLAILFIDLDHFKEVNDTLGHDAGDRLLIEAARRIGYCLRGSDTVARMGGDEFTLVLSELHGNERLSGILENLLAAMSSSFHLGNEQVFVSASIGITMYPADGREVESLFKNADQALYVAKGAGRNRFSFFTPALQEAAQNRVRLANDLRSGLSEQQFRVVFQPIVDFRSGEVRKAEALIRWQHPTRGLISPAEFIPIAESSGLIIDIGDWVFQQAATQAKRWRASHHPEFQISVNKSPVQFHNDAGHQRSWVDQLRAMQLSGDSLVVEITEGLLLDTSASVTEQLLQLRDAGIQVSLDDFGTGYSSLTYLQKFDIDYLKIDQSFVRHLIPDCTELALCKAIIVMAHELGMKVIAEGVETAGQRDLLIAAGCDFGQGYLFARPMPAPEFDVFLAASASPRRERLASPAITGAPA